MSEDVGSGVSSMLPCPFCACSPFVDSPSFEYHFIKFHRSSLFPDPNTLMGSDEGLNFARLAIFYDGLQPPVRNINIKLASLIGCEPKVVRNFKKTLAFPRAMTAARDSMTVHGSLIDRDSSDSDPGSANFLSLKDNFDFSFIEQVSDLEKDISNLSSILKENLDTSELSTTNNQKEVSISLQDRFPCLFCDRTFPSKIGLGLHKKARHINEYLLEIEHKYVNRRNHAWDEEEIRIMIAFEQDLILQKVKFVNIELTKLLPHRTHSQIAEMRKSRRYKLIKESIIFESSNNGSPPPSPAILLSPRPVGSEITTSSQYKEVQRAMHYLDSPSLKSPFSITGLPDTASSSESTDLFDPKLLTGFDVSPVVAPLRLDLSTPGDSSMLSRNGPEPSCITPAVRHAKDDSFRRPPGAPSDSNRLSQDCSSSTAVEPVINRTSFHHICGATTNQTDCVEPTMQINNDSLELRTFNYTINLPIVQNNDSFTKLDNLLINYAGNYQSNNFTAELSTFIIGHYKLNVDISVDGQCDFKNIKNFVFRENDVVHVDSPVPISNRKAKRLAFSKFQFLFRKNRSLACRQVLDGTCSSGSIDPNSIREFWSDVMRARVPGHVSNPLDLSSKAGPPLISEERLWAPITIDEINKNLPRSSSAAGPDGLTARKLNNTPRALLCRLLNSFILARRVPGFLCEAKTILIPKVHNASRPGDLRPISMSSLLHRLFHRILAGRISGANDYRFQFGFRDFDGTGTCAMLTDFVIKYARQHCKSVHLAFMDLKKAFDSVDHNFLWKACRKKGLPSSFIEYLSEFYDSAGTFLMWRGRSLCHLRPGRGVRQGDPLSSTLFNIVIEAILEDLDSNIGFDLPDARISHLAYADDVSLVASTYIGLQLLVDRFIAGAAAAGLDVNIAKTRVLALKSYGKVRKVIPYQPPIKIDNSLISFVTFDNPVEYMGLAFDPTGLVPRDLKHLLTTYLDNLHKLRAKPQQKLYILREVLLPRFHYYFSFYSYAVKTYLDFDVSVRKFVKNLLHLPKDVPNAFFYSTILDGGLGLFNARWRAPLLRFNKLKLFGRNFGGFSDAVCNHIASASDSILNYLKLGDGNLISNSKDICSYFKNMLYNSNDGRDLDLAGRVNGQNNWLRPNNFISGRDFINFIKLRINALPSKVRLTRGDRNLSNKMCRHGCDLTETTYHVVQQCPRTHGWRVRRHDRVVQYLQKRNTSDFKTCFVEPRIITDRGLRKPDLIIVEDGSATVVDVQVTGNDRNFLNDFNSNKINYYGGHPGFVTAVRNQYNVADVKVLALTISFKGLFNRRSVTSLLAEGLVRRRDLPFIASKAMVGTLSAFNYYYKSTV